MYVKVVDPCTRATMTFECHGEVYHERVGPLTQEGVEQWHDWQRSLRYDERHFIVWPRDRTRATALTMCEIKIPGTRGRVPVAVLTNHDVWLVNDRGQNIDRLHRHSTPIEIVEPEKPILAS